MSDAVAGSETTLANATLRIPDETIRRYRAAGRTWLRGDYVHRILADVESRRVLDLNCGDGVNAVLLALRGAHVTAVAGSIEEVNVARRRAMVNGVDHRIDFHVAPLGAVPDELSAERFDVVHGAGVLQHLLLDSALLPRVVRLSRPGGRLVFIEPISTWRWMRKLRDWLRQGTPPSALQPLGLRDIAELRRQVPGLHVRYFGFLTFALLRAGFALNYELGSVPERLTWDSAAIIDQVMFRILRLRGLASSAVVTATLPAPADGSSQHRER